jgi:2-hydroxychromene-2-carboxylate isomerase
MAAPIDFYFDFISPYGYAAASRIDALGERHGAPVRWRAFNMRSVNANVLGVKEPLFLAPLKGPYFQQDAPRTIRYFDLPYNPASVLDFNPLAAMRAFWFLTDADPALGRRFAWRIFQLFFAEKTTPNDPEEVAAIAGGLGADARAVLNYVTGHLAKERLKAETEAAIAAGVWGTPTFIVDDQIFWGSDRLQMLDDWLARGGW